MGIVPVDTVKQVQRATRSARTISRERLILAQTPAGFPLRPSAQAFDKAREDGFSAPMNPAWSSGWSRWKSASFRAATAISRSRGPPIWTWPGSSSRRKAGAPTEAVVSEVNVRTGHGLGCPSHRRRAAADSRRRCDPVGVRPRRPFRRRRSFHAITDALLGAAALGDIGMHFPDTDPRWKGCDSLSISPACCDARREQGFQIVNVDSTVILERPKLKITVSPFANRWRALGLELERVSVKFKTAEKVGPVGEGRSAEAQAVATIARD